MTVRIMAIDPTVSQNIFSADQVLNGCLDMKRNCLSVAAGEGFFVRSDAGDCNLFPMGWKCGG